MYKLIISRAGQKPITEEFSDYFDARARAEWLYLYGNEIEIEKDGKVISKFVIMGGKING